MKTGIFTMKRVLAFTIAVVASMTMLAGGREKFCKKMKKLVDVRDFSGIIRTVQKIPIQLYYAQSTTGGRLGVRLCQM